jgi:hypothetical protein
VSPNIDWILLWQIGLLMTFATFLCCAMCTYICAPWCVSLLWTNTNTHTHFGRIPRQSLDKVSAHRHSLKFPNPKSIWFHFWSIWFRGLLRQIRDKRYHSLLGDREKCRKTFREFVVYDDDQVYPEFAVWYERVYEWRHQSQVDAVSIWLCGNWWATTDFCNDL